MSELQIGQSLTPEQVLSLPDGAGVELCVAQRRETFAISDYAKTCILALMARTDFRSAVLVSLPTTEPSASEPYKLQRAIVGPSITELLESPAGPLTEPEPSPGDVWCNECQWTHERGQCPKEAAKGPSPGEGYRWLVPKVDVLRSDDEWKNQNGKFAPLPDWCVGAVADGSMMYRRRIEPQADTVGYSASNWTCGKCKKIIDVRFSGHVCESAEPPEPTPRASSEIEREAARILLDTKYKYLIDHVTTMSAHQIGHTNKAKFVASVEERVSKFREVESYARSIGAIE